jgi:hypothetical protein
MTTNLALCFQYVPSAFLLTLSTSLVEIGSRSSVTYGLPYESAGGTAPLGGYSELGRRLPVHHRLATRGSYCHVDPGEHSKIV